MNKLIMFIIIGAITLSFLPIINDLAIDATTNYLDVSFTLNAGDTITLTQQEYDALLELYNGNAYGLTLKISNGNEYELVRNFNIVDNDHQFISYNPPFNSTLTYYELFDNQSNRAIFTFFTIPSIPSSSFFELASNLSFDYLGQSINITNPSTYTITFSVPTENQSLALMIPILSILVGITTIVLYIKFK